MTDEERRRIRAEMDEAKRLYDLEHVNDDKRWWCYQFQDSGNCQETRALCEKHRGSAAPADGSRCERQERAGCFRVRLVLIAPDEDTPMCSPTMKLCKKMRAYVVEHESADAKMMSECEVR